MISFFCIEEAISEDTDRDWKNLVFQHPDVVETWEAYIRHTLVSCIVI